MFFRICVLKSFVIFTRKPKTLTEDTIIKDPKIFLYLKKMGRSVIRDIKNLFVLEEDYYKPVRIDNFHNGNYIEYRNNGDRIKSIKEYLKKLKHTLDHVKLIFCLA